MSEFLAIVTSFPTVVFSVLLIVAALFWLLTIVGLVDIEVLDFDIDIDAEVDASGVGVLAGMLLKYGLHGIPVTVVVSALVLLSWLLSYFGSAYLLSWLPGAILHFIGGAVLIVACLMVSLPIAGASLRPMRPLFTGEQAVRNDSLVGKSCEVRSLEVSDTFGQGAVQDVGAPMIINIRAAVPNAFKQGDTVAITSYDPDKHTYQVMSEEEFLAL